ncbi:MAG: UDP-N-acetylmuramoyl-L-alanyl-D-glutamate--2,6-diaminopimelate ligase [Minisyncoccia bacterium]
MKQLNKNFKKIWWGIKSQGARYYYGNPSKKLKIVGVTGTNGKTTTATLLYKTATSLGYKAGLISTVENIVGKEVRPATHTTPDSITLTKIFSDMVKEGCEYAFMEVSSHALDQNRVAGVNFVGGIFTNLTHDHLDYHKNFDNYFGAKKKFFQMLPPRAFALTNADDEYGLKMLHDIKANQFSYGFQKGYEDVQFHGEIKKIGVNGLEVSFNKIKVKSKLLGKFNAYNLLAVWSACSLLGFDMQKVNKIFEHIEPPSGRFQHFLTSSGVLVVVDYAHTPDALENILSSVGEIKQKEGRIISVFGCGGDRDPMKRPIMGSIGAKFSDVAIFTSDNPRSEDPDKIISEMLAGLHTDQLKKVIIMTDRRKAIKHAVKIAKEGDIILCAGKGHETYQDAKGEKSHFDDMEEFKKAL